MARLSREQNQALTRSRLLTVAKQQFARDGYAASSLDRIADEAGFSKGAVYSNFAGKEELFLGVLEEHGRVSLDEILAELQGARDIEKAIDRIAAWATRSSRQGNWPMLILEYSRVARPADTFRKSQEKVLRAQWKALGEVLLQFDPKLDVKAEVLGALVFELTYAPAMSFVSKPTSGDLLRTALRGLFGTLR
ncbi:TetR/AcrR family transcriptional regulator [Burkholderia sp. 8Y]|uniref:TetR/AcrR family transcriptional regulator n=1 Tax=Burkholderia sp. 8Y TaxID=2653133 RepID=UPI0012F404ED|nr:TetR/AcrR family transcriptional regulator [Burkholderia sp. 8Y]VXB42486.1 TetR/AcrR family transcriptional regulator [Burkholderia sp. 8Y]